ncbi:ricin-type beta-trefoil lectin domain protein [Micromonospora sp. NBC_00858]|uniref:ricin-type beta-trefoil lectin domain protein n=1 Tax=Micromonospora sp. NBC_00858 TaxID=2975979 RepID=UPI003866ECBE|nr:ricin-type beta-trefoil lectin domain protein [Micromonospora sp. NBC_00858]
MVAAVLVVVVALATTAVISLSVMTDQASPRDVRHAVPVPRSLVQAIPAAALSCPVLTPARLAAQVMEASGFDLNGGKTDAPWDVAGLSDDAWRAWRPAASSSRTDATAGVVALARYMCDLSGQVRAAGISGDGWKLALSAHESGLDSVRAVRGIPERARPYVKRVSAYAEWYARQPELAPVPRMSSEVRDAATKAVPVPEEYVAAVLAAGRRCEAVTPARVAGQLMAASAFDPNLHGPDGGQGVAQFLPSIWKQYVPAAPGSSPWTPRPAIEALGAVMCTLVAQLKEPGVDSYDLALAAFRRGPDAVKRARKVPDSAVLPQFLVQVYTYAAVYQADPRLSENPPTGPAPVEQFHGPVAPRPPVSISPTNPGLLAAGPGRRPASGPIVTSSPDRTTSAGKPAPVKPAPVKPAPAKPTPTKPPAAKPVSGPHEIVVHSSGRCLDVTDGAYGSNPQLQIWSCNGGPNQAWTFYSDGTIRAFERCMTAKGGATKNETKVILSTCSGSAAQRFTLNGSHDLVNVRADRCVDVIDKGTDNGAKLQLWDCAGTDNQKWSR